MKEPLIAADDTLMLWGILIIVASISIILEQRFKWASRISGAIIALVMAIILSYWHHSNRIECL